MKTAISIPDAVFEAAELVAERLGMSRSELYSRAVARYVAKHDVREVRERLDSVYSVEPARVDPVLDHLQLSTLGRTDSDGGDW